MNFGFTPPDPEKIEQSLLRIKDAFNAAAAADTGPAQPHFQKLSDTFSKLLGEATTASSGMDINEALFKILPIAVNARAAFMPLIAEARKNKAALEALQDLMSAISNEMSELMGGSFKMPFPDMPAPPSQQPSPKPILKLPAPKKPRPKDGGFKL